MDPITSNPTNLLVSPSTPVFGDNVQDLLNAGALNINSSGIIVVNSIADQVDNNNGVTTLRDAINQANADKSEDLIVFDRSLFSTPQTITLSLGELDITHSLDIVAPRDPITGTNQVSVSGNNATRVLEIETGATVNLSGLLITGGSLTGDNGGGISNSGTLNLDSTIVSNNNVTSNFTYLSSGTLGNGYGGGIYNTGTLNLSNSNVSNNAASGGNEGRFADIFGGGIYNTGSVFISNSTLSSNTANGGVFLNGIGGGIYNSGSLVISNSTLNNSARVNSIYSNAFGGSIYNIGTLDVSNSTISGSAITGVYTMAEGGGIYNAATATIINSTITNSMSGGIYNTGNLTVGNTIITNNTAGSVGGGGILNGGILTVSNSTISGNRTPGISKYSSGDGGGILNNGILTVSNSTISGNTADGSLDGTGGGGGIYNSGTTKVIDSTISSNNASYGYGGGIYNNYGGTLTLLFSTVTQNIATNVGGLYQNDVALLSTYVRGAFNVHNTIIANNRGKGVSPDVSGTFTSNGYNLIGDSTGSTGFDESIGDLVGTSDSVIDPRLDILAFNGGPTQTIALLTDSPAIGAADPIILDSDPTTDQRGLPRRAADGSADIGAFQFS